MNDPLARFRTLSTPAAPVAPVTPVAPKAQEPAAPVQEPAAPVVEPTTKVLNPALQAALAKLAPGKLQAAAQAKASNTMAALLTAKTETASAETIAITQRQIEIPAEILTNPALEKIEGFPAQQFLQHLGATYRALQADQPGLAGMLEAINQNLRQYEELSYLLNDDQLALYVNGALAVSKAQIKTTAPKKSTAQLHLDLAKQNVDFSQM